MIITNELKKNIKLIKENSNLFGKKFFDFNTTCNEDYIKLIEKYPNIKEYILQINLLNGNLKESFSILSKLIESEKNESKDLNDDKINEYIKSMHSKLSEIELLTRKKMLFRKKYLFDNYENKGNL